MVHPDSTLKYVNPVIGSGVFATEYIPKGTLTYVKDSLEIIIDQKGYTRHTKAMQNVIDKYSYIDEIGQYIISWDNAKYINHSCYPNTISTGYGFEIAIRDIYPGDEITDEYGIFNLEQGFNCECGSPNCRKKVLPEDLDNIYPEWDEAIRPALLQFEQVPQPLAPFLEKDTMEELREFLTDNSRYKSVHQLRYKLVEKRILVRN